MLPEPVPFSSAMRALGLGDGMRVVVYDSYGLFSAPRVWWMLRTFGVRDVYVLDGGLPAWKAEGRPVDGISPPGSTTAPSRASTTSRRRSAAASRSSTPGPPIVSAGRRPNLAPA